MSREALAEFPCQQCPANQFSDSQQPIVTDAIVEEPDLCAGNSKTCSESSHVVTRDDKVWL